MPESHDSVDWEREIRGMIARNTSSAPTEEGVYRMPCGNCYVDFFRSSDGSERWLIPGDSRTYTRETVATFRHGEFPWERMYTLHDAAAEIQRQATAADMPVQRMIEQLTAIAEAEKAAEDEEIARILRERPATSEEIPLADLALKFGIDMNDL